MAYNTFSSYNYLNDDEEEKKKASQKASVEQKKKREYKTFTQLGAKADSFKEPDPIIKTQEPVKQEEKQQSFFGKAAKAVGQVLFGKKEEDLPTDNRYPEQVAYAYKAKLNAEQQLKDLENRRSEVYKNTKQVGGTPEAKQYEDQKIALQETVKAYDNFLGRETERRGVFKSIFEGVKDVEGFLGLDKYWQTSATSKENAVMKKYQSGEELTQDEQIFYNRHVSRTLDAYIGRSLGQNVGEVVSDMPGYAMEIAVMSQLAGSDAKYAEAGKGITNALKLTSKTAKSIVTNIMSNSIKAGVAGSISAPSIDAKTAEYMIPEYDINIGENGDEYLSLVKEGYSKDKAQRNARLSTMVEFVSEGVGNYIDDAVPFLKKAFISKWLSNKGATSSTLTKTLLSKANINGIISEVIEEEIGEPFQALLDEREYNNPFTTPEGRERLLVEVLGMGVFKGISNITDSTEQALKKRRQSMPGDKITLNVDPKLEQDEAMPKVELPKVIQDELNKREAKKENKQTKRETIKLDNKPDGVDNAVATIRPDGTAGMVVELSKEAQGKGLGTDIVKQLEGKIQEKGISDVSINAYPESQGFWEKQGYTVAGEKNNSGFIPMTKQLKETKVVDNKKRNAINTKKITQDTISGKREEFRLDTAEKIGKHSQGLKNAKPTDTVEIYRAGTGDIKAGEYVSIYKPQAEKYLKDRKGSKIYKSEVNISDLVYGNGLKTEFVYSPKESAKKETKTETVKETAEKKERPPHILKGIEKSKKLKESDVNDMIYKEIKGYLDRGDDIKSLNSQGGTLGDFEGSYDIKKDIASVELADGRKFKVNINKLAKDKSGLDTTEKIDIKNIKPISNKFYTVNLNGRYVEEPTAKYRSIEGFDTFLHKVGKRQFKVSDALTGSALTGIWKTQYEAEEDARQKIKDNIDKIPQLQQEVVDKNGLSPRYSKDGKSGIIKQDEKQKEPTTSNDSGRGTGSGKLSDTTKVGDGKPQDIKSTTKEPSGEVARGKRSVSDAEPRVGSGTQLTPKQQIEVNKQVIDLLKKNGTRPNDNNKYSDKDKELLRQYSGAGGLEKAGAEGRGLLDEYYTPTPIVDLVWDKVKQVLPLSNVKIFEPSLGIGKFFDKVPFITYTANGSEIDQTSSDIARILHPGAFINTQPFEAKFMSERGKSYADFAMNTKYDVIVGNPPYGEHRGRWMTLGEEPKIKKYEEYFLKRGLDITRNGGIVAYVMPSNFLNNGVSYAKQEIAKMGNIVDAYKLPNGVFGTTTIGTDIVIIRKLPTTAEEEISRRELELSGGQYFKDNPDKILGEVSQKKGRFGMEEVVSGTIEDAIKKAKAQEEKPIIENEQPVVGTAIEETVTEPKDNTAEVEKLVKAKDKRNEAREKKLTADRVEDTEVTTEKINSIKQEEYVDQTKTIDTLEEIDAEYNSTEEQEEEIKDAETEKDVEELSKVKQPKKISVANQKIIYEPKKKDKTKQIDTNVSKKDVEMWKQVNVTGELNDNAIKDFDDPLVIEDKNIAVSFDGKTPKYYLPFMYYQGDIYSKLDELESNKDRISPEQYKIQKKGLEDVLPTPKKINEITISPISSFAKDINIVTKQGYPNHLMGMFKAWMQNLPYEAFGGSDNWEINGYLRGSIVNTGDKLRNIEIKKRRRAMGNLLFKKFLNEEMNDASIKIVEDKYNRQFNGYVRPDYKKVPLTSPINSKFKNKPLNIKPIQREGAAFLTTKGVGLLGYDVGVGKTLTAITAINEVMQKGWTKKPLIVVPNGVYLNWIKEISEVIPNVKINLLNNLGGKFKGDLKTLEIEEGTLSVITYDGLNKLGFKQDTYDELGRELKDVMQGSKKLTERGRELENARIDETVGKAIKNTTDEKFFEDLGFDHVTIDEVHNFKNIFSKAKLERGTKNEYQSVQGSTSMRGVKAYFMTQYILKQNQGRNVFLLSATPFTNSPLEIYSILSLMGKKRLEDIGLKNVNDFMSMFMELKPTFVVKADQKVVEEDIVEKFNNLQQLQQMVTEFIDFRTGEEAGVNRPNRIKRTTMVSPSDLQKRYAIEAEVLFNDKKNGGTLKAISELQNIALSPYLSQYNREVPTYTEFVENSPKIKFAMEAIKQVKKDKPNVGQVIYMPRGIKQFPYLVKYLTAKLGYKANQIGIISGGMTVDRKQAIQNSFNSGKIKILIGTESMKEGVNLQENATELYHLHLPWNPTDMLQVEGRIWRQGNQWKNVRIHYPLVENSVDSFIFQKLETKEKRIKNLWSYKGNKISVGDLDFEEMKLDLITDPVVRVQAEKTFESSKLKTELETMKQEQAFTERKISGLIKAHKDLKFSIERKKEAGDDIEEYRKQWYDKGIEKAKDSIKAYETDFKERGIDFKDLQNKSAALIKKVEAKQKQVDELNEVFAQKEIDAVKAEKETPKPPTDYKKIVADIKKENKTFFVKADGKLKAPGGTADVGGYADVKSLEKTLSDIKAVEMPELVKMARELMGNTPTLKRFSKALGKFYGVEKGQIKLNPEIFKDPSLTAKVLAHEVGHMTDFLEEGTLSRGNLSGRIGSLNKHLKDKYKDLSNKDLREELKALTKLWKPFNEDNATEGYIKYRYSSKELYADAISVLFNDPALLQKEAPKFWKGFFDYMDAKPNVKKNFFETWNLLNKGEEAVFKARDEEMTRGFQKGEQAFVAKELEKRKQQTSLPHQLQLLFDDVNTPIIKKLRQAQKEGKVINPKDNPEYALHGMNYLDGKLKNYVNDNFQPVFEKAQEVDDGWNTLGKILFFERVMNERGELANPQGYDPLTAKQQLSMMEKNISENEWAKLQEAKELFRVAVSKSVENATKNKFYTPELLKQMQMNPAYATYQVVDYLDTYISSKVYKSVGTLKDVANVATSTVMKLISVEKAIEKNNAKKLNIEFFKKQFPDEVKQADTKWNGTAMQIKDPSDTNTGLVVTIVDGKPQGWYMDKNVADTLNYSDNNTIKAMAKISQIVSQSKLYRPLFTTFNLGFQSFNFVRDFMRYWKNMPDQTLGQIITSFPRAIARYAQAVPYAAARATNTKNKLIQEMENAKILGLTYNDHFRNDVDEHQQQIERVLEKSGVLAKTKRNKLFAPFYLLLDAIEISGNFVETLPKVAGYIELKDKMPKEQLAEFVRRSIGSPDFRIRGTATPVTNSIFLFSNAIKEGIKSDMKIAFTKNPSRSGFWVKTVIGSFLPKFIMSAIAYGLLGDDLEKLLGQASEYDKTNYTIIPLYEDENGKAVYIRVPQDETGRFYGGLLWKMLNLTKDEASVQDIYDIFSFGAGQFPNLSPSFKSMSATAAYLSGENPYDSFRGRNVIPDKEFNAGYKYSFPIFADWFIKTNGLGILYPTTSNYYNENTTQLQETLNAPFISNVLGRWVKVSNYGEVEGYQKQQKAEREVKAQEQIKDSKTLDDAIKEYKSGTQNMTRRNEIEKRLVQEVVGKPPYKGTTKTKATNTKKKFRISILRGEADPKVNAIITSQNNAEKTTLLLNMKEDMDRQEFRSLVLKLKDYKVISDDVIKGLK